MYLCRTGLYTFGPKITMIHKQGYSITRKLTTKRKYIYSSINFIKYIAARASYSLSINNIALRSQHSRNITWTKFIIYIRFERFI